MPAFHRRSQHYDDNTTTTTLRRQRSRRQRLRPQDTVGCFKSFLCHAGSGNHSQRNDKRKTVIVITNVIVHTIQKQFEQPRKEKQQNLKKQNLKNLLFTRQRLYVRPILKNPQSDWPTSLGQTACGSPPVHRARIAPYG